MDSHGVDSPASLAILTTPASAASVGLSDSIPVDLEGDTIICEAPPGHKDWDSEDDADMEDIPSPTFNNTPMTDKEKAEATERWTIHGNKYEKRKRQKNSYVYCYMKRTALKGELYPEVKGGLNIL
ncbi:hypothetical protein B0J14DRAFT_652796 [Halenospora varia]|nr:hypothetical protein B0J14DRAFT_652796 [Halenospora varia]